MFPLKDSIKIPVAPLVTYLIIAINAAVFLYQTTLSPREAYVFSLRHALVPLRYFDPTWAAKNGLDPHDYLPLIEGTFMHGGWWHIILNMWTLFIFGSSLEGRIGKVRFASFYLVCGILASVCDACFNRDSDVPTLGASGAIAGILGGYATTFPRARITMLILVVFFPLFFRVPALGYAFIWFILQFMQGFVDLVSPSMGTGIAWWAHIGGFLAGIILIPIFRPVFDPTHDEGAGPLSDIFRWPPQTPKGKPPSGTPPGWTRGPWG